MRKGARKTSASERADESLPNGLTEVTAEVTVGGSRLKRVRASNRPAAEPEFFEDKRNLVRAAMKHDKIDCIKKYEYCLPYPLKEDEDEQSTKVTVLFPAEPEPVCCEYNWARNKYEDYTEQLIKDGELHGDQKEALAFLKEKAEERKKANEEAREARRKALEEMSEETRSGSVNMKMYKFYPVPTPDTPDISSVKVPYKQILREGT